MIFCVGTGVRPQSETDFVVLHLFDDEDDSAAAEGPRALEEELPTAARAEGLVGVVPDRRLTTARGVRRPELLQRRTEEGARRVRAGEVVQPLESRKVPLLHASHEQQQLGLSPFIAAPAAA